MHSFFIKELRRSIKTYTPLESKQGKLAGLYVGDDMPTVTVGLSSRTPQIRLPSHDRYLISKRVSIKNLTRLVD